MGHRRIQGNCQNRAPDWAPERVENSQRGWRSTPPPRRSARPVNNSHQPGPRHSSRSTSSLDTALETLYGLAFLEHGTRRLHMTV